MLDDDRCWQACEAGDARFDGWFYVGVTSTGIYCRPSCPARTPRRANVRFHPSAASAQAAGFRACKRCRPDATPGSPEWDTRADLVGRAMRLIADGVVDREGVPGLAARLGYTERHLHRCLVEAAGAGPLALARAQRAQTARVLLETTAVPVSRVAVAAGFRSVRQFNATIREVFAASPRELREAAHRRGRPPESGTVALRLPVRRPFDGAGLLGFLGARAVPGVESWADGVYARSLALPSGEGVVELEDREDHVAARFRLADLRDLPAALRRVRALLDLDADPQAVLDALGRDAVLGRLVRRAPGRRVPGTVDGPELAVRAVLGQQVSVAGARTLAGRLAEACGAPLERPLGTVTRLFPEPAAIAALGDAALPMPAARRRGLRTLAGALAAGDVVLDGGADRAEAPARLLALPGIGPWTAAYVSLRALRDPDAFLAGDLGVRRGLEKLGHDGRPPAAERLSAAWRPYRASAVMHLWAAA